LREVKKRRFVAVRHRVGYGGIAVMDLFAKPGSLGSGPAFWLHATGAAVMLTPYAAKRKP
jgi:hypothetical protein